MGDWTIVGSTGRGTTGDVTWTHAVQRFLDVVTQEGGSWRSARVGTPEGVCLCFRHKGPQSFWTSQRYPPQGGWWVDIFVMYTYISICAYIYAHCVCIPGNNRTLTKINKNVHPENEKKPGFRGKWGPKCWFLLNFKENFLAKTLKSLGGKPFQKSYVLFKKKWPCVKTQKANFVKGEKQKKSRKQVLPKSKN